MRLKETATETRGLNSSKQRPFAGHYNGHTKLQARFITIHFDLPIFFVVFQMATF
jgi:hypothetical protein